MLTTLMGGLTTIAAQTHGPHMQIVICVEEVKKKTTAKHVEKEPINPVSNVGWLP